MGVWGTVTAARPEPVHNRRHTILTEQLLNMLLSYAYTRWLCECVVPLRCNVLHNVMWDARHPNRTVMKWVLIFTVVLSVWLLPYPQLKPLSPNIYWMIALQLPLFNNCVYCFHSFEWNYLFIKKGQLSLCFVVVWNKNIQVQMF